MTLSPKERMIDFAKKLLKASPIPFSKNHLYDLQSRRIFSTRLHNRSNCIDVGCHKGEILDELVKAAPEGTHFGFEPIPVLFENLIDKYKDRPNIRIQPQALSDHKGESTFNYVVSNPSYSGLIKRKYDRPNEEDTEITVQVELLDNIIPAELPIDLIKIDVEGGELNVLRGATRIISKYRPIVIFEHGRGAADFYKCTPQHLFEFFEHYKMGIFNLGDFLKNGTPLTLKKFEIQYDEGQHYYFVAGPV